MAKDILDRELAIGDYVVFHNNIYLVKSFVKAEHYVKIMLLHPSKTTRPVLKMSRDCCLIPGEDVVVWKLKQGFSD